MEEQVTLLDAGKDTEGQDATGDLTHTQVDTGSPEEPLQLWREVQVGNFGLVLGLPLQNLDELDDKGFSMLHYAVTYNNLEAVKWLLRGGATVDLFSKYHQTALMIGANFGFVEIVKLLVDHGASVNVTDSYYFTPLLYAIKMKHHALMMWLMCKGAEIMNLADNNGCSPVHWAAYENDTFSLYFMKAVGVEINLLDKQGYTPVTRACHNYSYGALRFLCENYPDMIMYGAPPGTSKSMVRYLRTQLAKFQTSRNAFLVQLNLLREAYHQSMICALFLALTATMIYTLVSAENFQVLTNSQVWFIGTVVYVIVLMYFALCSVWFVNRTSNTPDQGKRIASPKKKAEVQAPEPQPEAQEQSDQHSIEVPNQWQRAGTRFSWYNEGLAPAFLKDVTIKSFLQVSYKQVETVIDSMANKPPDYLQFANRVQEHQEELKQIMEIDDPLWSESFTIIHLVYFLMETNRFTAIHQIDWNRVCPTCLQYKSPRTVHCGFTKRCVKDFHLYSSFYRKCINSTNHLFYLGFLTLQLFVYGIYLLFFWMFYVNQCSSRWYVFYPFEMIYVIFGHDGWFTTAFYSAIYTTYLYQLVFWIVEVYCVCLNITYNELINSNRYRYLYMPEKVRSGKLYLIWKPRMAQGLMYNIIMYLGNSFKNLVLV